MVHLGGGGPQGSSYSQAMPNVQLEGNKQMMPQESRFKGKDQGNGGQKKCFNDMERLELKLWRWNFCQGCKQEDNSVRTRSDLNSTCLALNSVGAKHAYLFLPHSWWLVHVGPHKRVLLVFVVTWWHLCISIWMEHTVSISEQLEMRGGCGKSFV